MDTITTPAGQYTVPATSIVHNAQVSLTDRSPASIVHLTQYDTTMPIIAVALTANGQPYTVPTGAAVNVRLAKSDGTYVYNPALGVSEDARTAYIGTTVQMTTVWGRLNAIVEVVLNGAVAGTGIFILDITANPIPESAIESTSEFLTIQQIAAQVQQAADLLEQQSTNLQNVTDNLIAIQNAAANAIVAENASEEAKQAAQQALGFRTFFDAISPDANGSLDPSRPMTTAAAQASWTVKSKGDRIQSVKVNGFSQNGYTAGLNKKAVLPTSGWSIVNGIFFLEHVVDNAVASLGIFSNAGPVVGTSINDTTTFASLAQNYTYVTGYNVLTGRMYIKAPFSTTGDLYTWMNQISAFVAFYTTASSAVTGLYIPIQAQGHEYRCQCLPIAEVLGVGDNVQSNVPSEFDVSVVFDGSSDEAWTQTATSQSNIYRYGIQGSALSVHPIPGVNAQSGGVMSNRYPAKSANDVSAGEAGIAINTTPIIYICDPSIATLDAWKASLQQNPITVFYKSASANGKELPVLLETHANGNVYAHNPVTLVVVPYTEADVSAAQQLAATPTTLPYIDSADVPMLLDAAEPTAAAAPLASTSPVAGTYIVSSQDGTTVAITLKAFQDGGDAATLGGMTAVEAMLNFVYPVGSIYMSTANVSPQTFLGGTWQQIQGQFLLAASGSYPAGSTGGAAQQTLATENIAAHNHGPAAGERFLSIGGATNGALVSPGTGVMDVEWNANWATADTGSGEPFSIMPPYLAVYMWQRTA